MPRVLRPFILGLAATATAVAAVACEPDPSFPVPAPVPVEASRVQAAAGKVAAAQRVSVSSVPRRLAIVGDSITYSSAPHLTAAFSGIGWNVSITSKPGDMFRERMPYAAELAAARPDVAIVNLGTNDLSCALANALTPKPCRYPDFTMEAELADADQMRALFPADVCFVAVAPTFDVPIGDHWRRVRARGGITHVADWYSEAKAHPEYLTDGLGHLTEVGRTAYARFLQAETTRVCGTGR